MIIAIDGPAGTGKSTICALLAKELGILYLNSGSFYRALTLALLESKADISDEDAVVEFCKQRNIEYKNAHLILDGADVESRLHEDAVSVAVSKISAIVRVRHLVNDKMREITAHQSIICEGRDMTTVVFPNAQYKFYLDASLDVQAKRRYEQGVSRMTLEEVKRSIKERDAADKNKAEGSLVQAADAQYIDTSDLTIDDVCGIIRKRVTAEKMEK